jgi:hypothetical protein
MVGFEVAELSLSTIVVVIKCIQRPGSALYLIANEIV